ncbi:hypothetical protein NH340_JMT03293 [Sarcoptes scabiei]|nr:hypothetical protein NH340_JMT03293 [Sarcoptes scabiei]
MDSLSIRNYFCHYCGSLLCQSPSSSIESFYEENYGLYSEVRFQCYQCQAIILKKIRSTSFVPLRQILKAEIIKDSDMWANASKTEEKCPKCSHQRAYYLQIQTRSADEPMTTYYRCEKCAHNWKD